MEYLSKTNFSSFIRHIVCLLIKSPFKLGLKRQIARQAFCGFLTTLIDIFLFQLLISLGYNAYFVTVLTFYAAVIVNFTLTRLYVFSDFCKKHLFSDFGLYCVSCLGSLILSELCLLLFHGFLLFNPLIAKILSLPLIFSWTVVTSRLIFIGKLKQWRNSMNKNITPQTEESLHKNSSYFLTELDTYSSNIYQMVGYRYMYTAVSQKLEGVKKLLDIGNGGVFDYDISIPQHITAVDLFLDQLNADYIKQEHITLLKGDALNLPFTEPSFDGCVMVMLLHHLIGHSVEDNYKNLYKSLQEAYRILLPGGKLIIMESCVPSWFCTFEKKVFKLASLVIEKTLKHPPTFQFTEANISDCIYDVFKDKPELTKISKGKHVLQFGFKVPSWLTPVYPVLFVVNKPINE